MNDKRIICSSAAVAGKRHISNNIPCQDHTSCLIYDDNTAAIALSDGAGSKKFAKESAQIIVEACLDYFKECVKACDLRVSEINSVKLTIIGSVTKRRVRNLSILAFEAADETGKIKIAYFNAPYLANTIKPGTTHIFRGVVRKKGNFFTMDQPKMYDQSQYAALMGKMQPRYPLVKGLTNNAVLKAQEQVFKNLGAFEEFVPESNLRGEKI